MTAAPWRCRLSVVAKGRRTPVRWATSPSEYGQGSGAAGARAIFLSENPAAISWNEIALIIYSLPRPRQDVQVIVVTPVLRAAVGINQRQTTPTSKPKSIARWLTKLRFLLAWPKQPQVMSKPRVFAMMLAKMKTVISVARINNPPR